MNHSLKIAHFSLRTHDLPAAIEWYGRALGANVRFRNEFAAFMSFDDEHHRFVLWNDGDTVAMPEHVGGVDHIGFSCRDAAALADEYERLKDLGITPILSVNHHFTLSVYYSDPAGNEVEITCDNMPTKGECSRFMASPQVAEAMRPYLFGAAFDPEELLRLRKEGMPAQELARIGL